MNDVAKAVHAAATDRIRAHERRRRRAHAETVRRQRRSAVPLPILATRRPEYWDYHPSHDPYHVRARAAAIGHAVSAAIKGGDYTPFPPAGFEVLKPGGGTRTVATFSIADEVISKRLYTSLLGKNRGRFSARSYAYRKDLGVHDAIVHMQAEWSNEHRLFVAQYDFADYFGSIDHEHIWSTISLLGMAITRTERRLLRAFLEAPLPVMLPSTMPTVVAPRERGVHQGTTISLLLANIAATPIDREFERLGVSFARYADDIVIWSRDYNALNRAVDELHRFAEQARCPINHTKSAGVHLLTRPEAGLAELTTTHALDFLSHRVGLRSIAIADRSLDAVKRSVRVFIYNHLLREPLQGTQQLRRLRGGLDRDYLALMWELRRYLYGSLSEEQLRRLLRGPLPPMISLGGILGRHPMINDVQQLQRFDSWMATQVWLALRKRARLLGASVPGKPDPWGFTQAQLAAFQTHSSGGARVDGRLPSSVRMAELVRRAVRAHGTRVATHTASLYHWA